MWGILMNQDKTAAPYFELIEKYEKILPPISKGDNPKVFLYDFLQFEGRNRLLCRLRFYGGPPIYVLSNQIETDKP